jgi:hypothetical protein
LSGYHSEISERVDQTEERNSPDKLVNVLLSITSVSSLDVMLKFPRSESSIGVAELEWPEKI